MVHMHSPTWARGAKKLHSMAESTLCKGSISISGHDLIKLGGKETQAHLHGHFCWWQAEPRQCREERASCTAGLYHPKSCCFSSSPGKSRAVSGMSASCWHQRCHQHEDLIVTEPLQTFSHTRGLKHHVWQSTEHSRGLWLADWEQVKWSGSPWHATGCPPTTQSKNSTKEKMGEIASSPPSLSHHL